MRAMTIAEAAKEVGVSKRHMHRRLTAAGVKFSGGSKKFFVTSEELERALPEFFGPDGSVRGKLAKLEREIATTKRKLNSVSSAVRGLKISVYRLLEAGHLGTSWDVNDT